eukprot:jgi/Chrpa1/25402/Chrysochromulina_OHIO_Genome00007223-RA
MTGIAIRVTAGSTIIQATIEVPSLGFSRTVMSALGGGLAQLSASLGETITSLPHLLFWPTPNTGKPTAPSSTYDVEQARLAAEQEAFEEERNISFVFKLRQAAKLGFSKKSGIPPNMSHTKAFSVLDKDGSGSISVSALKAALVKEGSSDVLEAEIQSLIDQVDVNGDGKLQLDEFEIFWDLFNASFEKMAAPKQTTPRSRAASLQTDGPPTRELTRERNRLQNPALDPEAAAVEAQAEEHARRTAGAGVGFEHPRELRQPPPSHLPPPDETVAELAAVSRELCLAKQSHEAQLARMSAQLNSLCASEMGRLSAESTRLNHLEVIDSPLPPSFESPRYTPGVREYLADESCSSPSATRAVTEEAVTQEAVTEEAVTQDAVTELAATTAAASHAVAEADKAVAGGTAETTAAAPRPAPTMAPMTTPTTAPPLFSPLRVAEPAPPAGWREAHLRTTPTLPSPAVNASPVPTPSTPPPPAPWAHGRNDASPTTALDASPREAPHWAKDPYVSELKPPPPTRNHHPCVSELKPPPPTRNHHPYVSEVAAHEAAASEEEEAANAKPLVSHYERMPLPLRVPLSAPGGLPSAAMPPVTPRGAVMSTVRGAAAYYEAIAARSHGKPPTAVGTTKPAPKPTAGAAMTGPAGMGRRAAAAAAARPLRHAIMPTQLVFSNDAEEEPRPQRATPDSAPATTPATSFSKCNAQLVELTTRLVSRTLTRTKQRRSSNELDEGEVELDKELRLAREDRLEIARDREDRLEIIAKEKATRELAARQMALGHEAYKAPAGMDGMGTTGVGLFSIAWPFTCQTTSVPCSPGAPLGLRLLV